MTIKDFEFKVLCTGHKLKADSKTGKIHYIFEFRFNESKSIEDSVLKLQLDSNVIPTGTVIALSGKVKEEDQQTLDKILGFEIEAQEVD